MTELPSHVADAFRATTRRDGRTLHLDLAGNADIQVAEPLHDLLAKLHAAAAELGIAHVAVDLRELEFMSSSCLKALVSWVSALQDTDYRIAFRANPDLRWQRRSLGALQTIAPGLVTVDGAT
jgi:anti-anti-sigma factor